MKLSTKARYAVMAMVDIASHDIEPSSEKKTSPISLAAIAQRQSLPLPYLEQLFNKLKKANLVQSCRGSAGGYSLSNSPQNITVLDIIRAVTTPLKATRCSQEASTGCHENGERCLTHDLWNELGSVVQLFLHHVTLADVCERRVLGMGRFFITYPTLTAKPSSALLEHRE